jgi:hypothetical protein
MKRSFLTAFALVALAAASALVPDLAMAATAAAPHASSFPFDAILAGAPALAAAWPATMKFQVRDGFVASVFTKVETAPDRFEIRQSDSYGGEVLDLSEADATANLHKLEPKDDAAAAFLASKTAPSEAPLSPQSIDQVVAAAVAQALANFTAGLQAAAAMAPAAPAAPAADTGGNGGKGGAKS